MRICVYGSASPTINPIFIEKVEEMGKQMVARGHSLVFGGGANGLMGAVARGTHENGGYVFGVIPKFFQNEDVEAVYNHCDKLVLPDTMRERKQIMEDNADAFIITPGGIGTFEEFFEILTLKQLCQHNKPIAVYNIDGYYNELEKMLDASVDKNFVKPRVKGLYFITENLDEIFNYFETREEIRNVKELKDG